MTLVSASIRFVPIFEGFIGERTTNDSRVIENMDFVKAFDATSSAR